MAKDKAEQPDSKTPGWRIRHGSDTRQAAEDAYSHPGRASEDEPTQGRHSAPPDGVEGYRPGRR